MAAERNITINAGDTYIHEVLIRDSANAVIDISGRTYAADLKRSQGSDDVVLSFTTGITDAVNGVMQFSASAVQTDALQSGKYFYDLRETNGSVVLTILKGDATVEE